MCCSGQPCVPPQLCGLKHEDSRVRRPPVPTPAPRTLHPSCRRSVHPAGQGVSLPQAQPLQDRGHHLRGGAGTGADRDHTSPVAPALPGHLSAAPSVGRSFGSARQEGGKRGSSSQVGIGYRTCVCFCYFKIRAQELCESRGGRPGLLSLMNLRFLWT